MININYEVWIHVLRFRVAGACVLPMRLRGQVEFDLRDIDQADVAEGVRGESVSTICLLCKYLMKSST